jgi:uncharacterized protein (TIGR02001 family)
MVRRDRSGAPWRTIKVHSGRPQLVHLGAWFSEILQTIDKYCISYSGTVRAWFLASRNDELIDHRSMPLPHSLFMKKPRRRLHMRTHLAVSTLSAVVALSCASLAHAEEDSPFSANVTLASDYISRGVSQTNEGPTIQGGFDYKHASGLYAGVWGSNISWLRDSEKGTGVSSGNSLELDVSLGYAREFGDFGIDVGVVRYVYPGDFDHRWKAATGMKDPNSTEGYVGFSWKFVSVKYYHAFTDLFGAPDSKGSGYLDLSASYELVTNLSLDAHYGSQRITGPSTSYKDWSLGATYTLGGVDLGLHYVDTDISHADKADADARFVFSISKSF